jgi:hypothetical protein
MTYTGDTHWLLPAPWGEQPSTSANGRNEMALHRGAISLRPNFLVLGACVRFRARTLHLAEPPPPKAVSPGGWIDLTREGSCDAENFGLLSFSVMAQRLVHCPYGIQ